MKSNRLSLILFVGFAIVFINLFQMQIVKGDYYRSLSEKNRIRVIYLEGPRGKILDRHGEVMATSRLSFNLSAIPREARKKIKESCEILGKILEIDPEILQKRYQKGKPGMFRTTVVAQDISPAQALTIEEQLDRLPGFVIETRPQREYPDKEAAAHLLGYTGPVKSSEKEFLEQYGYRQVDWLGREGLERN